MSIKIMNTLETRARVAHSEYEKAQIKSEIYRCLKVELEEIKFISDCIAEVDGIRFKLGTSLNIGRKDELLMETLRGWVFVDNLVDVGRQVKIDDGIKSNKFSLFLHRLLY